jgi:Pyruvate/2-oxoacid:ferredoxin oxidoreductase gamma subunit
MDLCGTTAAAGGAWVYRTTAFERELPHIMAQAIDQSGFAMLEIWELCTAYYSPRNKIKKKELYQLLENYNLKLGLIANNSRPEYSVQYRDAYETGKSVVKEKPKIEPEFKNAVSGQTGIIVAGSAGQKIKSTATLFAQASMFSDLQATQKDDYPITVMTGHSLAEIILSPDTIEYTGIGVPEFFIVISKDGLNRARATIASLPETSTLYAEESLELPEVKAKVIKMPFLQTAKEVTGPTVAVIAMGAMLKDSGLFPVKALEKAISAFQKPNIAEKNLKALAAGVALASPKKK